jgi:hypothetical protein
MARSIELAFTEADRTGLDRTQKHHLPRLHRRIARTAPCMLGLVMPPDVAG